MLQIVHDVDHPGRTNDFLVVSEDPLSIDYNDTSPLENHHLAYAFKLMKKPEHNFMEALDKETYRSIRALVIDLVIATDMKRHFDILSQFQVCARSLVCSTSPPPPPPPSPLPSPPLRMRFRASPDCAPCRNRWGCRSNRMASPMSQVQ